MYRYSFAIFAKMWTIYDEMVVFLYRKQYNKDYKKGGHMKDAKTFLKKNGFFVFLFIVMLFIIIALGIYIYVSNHNENSPPPEGQGPIVNKPKDEKKDAEITTFEGEYNQITRNMRVSWRCAEHDDKINKITLYLNNNYIDDVTSFSYYDFFKDTYGYPTGNNEIKLVVNLDNGKVIEKKITVFVNYLISASQSVKQTNTSMQLTLTYVYEKARSIKVPSITTDGHISEGAKYIDTKVKENNGIITAQTTYEFFWEDPNAYQQFSVRWKFNDIRESRDFSVEKGTPPKDS